MNSPVESTVDSTLPLPNMNSTQSTPHCALHMLYTAQCTIQYELYTDHFQYALHTMHSTLCTPHYALYSPNKEGCLPRRWAKARPQPHTPRPLELRPGLHRCLH